ncbi:hypothetical protein QC763_105195 [Podospora pseudopauciseta]|uniref:Uncharacterized protein n=1 Tax=Podospora pseudopauciseta TaxID=2093780 RepID=A0ABR0HXA4_9PEZI|nr:hypothetical protein QC763_105195 [Podospora pseudopauciseta]
MQVHPKGKTAWYHVSETGTLCRSPSKFTLRKKSISVKTSMKHWMAYQLSRTDRSFVRSTVNSVWRISHCPEVNNCRSSFPKLPARTPRNLHLNYDLIAPRTNATPKTLHLRTGPWPKSPILLTAGFLSRVHGNIPSNFSSEVAPCRNDDHNPTSYTHNYPHKTHQIWEYGRNKIVPHPAGMPLARQCDSQARQDRTWRVTE